MSTNRTIRFAIPAKHPRNPLVAAAWMRRAGAHRPAGKALRQRAAHALRHQLAHLHPPQP